MNPTFDDLVQNAPERKEYYQILRALGPVLWNLPPKVVTIDGRAGVGKTTLGRFLAWRFNSTLIETDLFLVPGTTGFEYRVEHLRPAIASQIGRDRPVFLEGVVALRVLRDTNFVSDFHIHIVCNQSEGNSVTEAAWSAYEREFRPAKRADIIVELPVL